MKNKISIVFAVIIISIAFLINYCYSNNIIQKVKTSTVGYLNERGKTAYNSEQYELSENYYRLAQMVDPNSKWAQYNVATAIIFKYWGKSVSESGKKDLEYAISLLESEEKKHPGSAKVWGMMGDGYYKLEDYDKAIMYYEKALEKSKNWEWGMHQLAQIYAEAKDDNKTGLKYIEQAINVKNSCTQKYFMYGWILSNLDRKKDAVKAYKKYLEFEPNDVAALVNISNLEIDIKDWDNARTHIELGLKRNPYSTYLLSNKFDVLMHDKKYDEAEDIALDMSTGRSGHLGYWSLARLEQVRGNNDKAEKYFKVAKDIAKDYYDKYCQNEYDDLSDKDGNCRNRRNFLKDFDKEKKEAPKY